MKEQRARVLSACLLLACGPIALQAQATVASATPFVPGGQQLVLLDFSTFPLGSVPVSQTPGQCLPRIPVCDIKGELEIVMQDGKPMLRASARSSFVIQLAQQLPANFTLEFDLIPKTCCQPEDLAFEGTPTIDQGELSAHVLWHHNSHAIVGGIANAGFSAMMPAHIRAAVMGSLTTIAVSFRGPSMTMYTDNEEIFSVQRAFYRGSVLRVFLGGQNDTYQAVYLSRLRIAGSGASAVATQPAAVPASANPLPNVGPGGTTTATNTNASTGRGGRGNPPAGRGGSTNPPPTTAPPTGSNPAGVTGPGTTLNPGVTRGTATAMNTGPVPTGLTVTGNPASATVQWLPVSGAVDYVVNRQVRGASAWTPVTPSPITTTVSPTDQPLASGTAYTYQVIAYQADRTFGVATIDYVPMKPQNPTGLRVSGHLGSTAQISWDPVPGAWEYLVSGPTITPGSGTVSATSLWVTTPPSSGVFRVVAVYQPGGVLTPQSSWPSVTVSRGPGPTTKMGTGGGSGSSSPSSPSGSGSASGCGCQRTGAFVRPTLQPITALGRTTTFTHPTHGRFTISVTPNGSSLDVTNAQGRVVMSYPLPVSWGTSRDLNYFVVAGTPQSTQGPAPVTVYRVNPNNWQPQLLDTSVHPDGRWGFSAGGKMFIVTRQQNSPIGFSFLAYNLESVNPNVALQQGGPDEYGVEVLTSPCDDRLMYFRWTQRQPATGEAIFYRRTAFGQGGGASVVASATSSSTPSASIVSGSSGYLVQLSGASVAGQTSFPSLQCSP